MAKGTITNLIKQTSGSGTVTNEYNVQCVYSWSRVGNVVCLTCTFTPATNITNGTGSMVLDNNVPIPTTEMYSAVYGTDGSAAEQKGVARLVPPRTVAAIGSRTANKSYAITFTYLTIDA